MTKNLTISIPDEVWAEMEKMPEVNWSQLARERFATYVQQRAKADLSQIVDRMRQEKGVEYEKGVNHAKTTLQGLPYSRFSVIIQEYYRILSKEQDELESDLGHGATISDEYSAKLAAQAYRKVNPSFTDYSEDFYIGFGKTLLELYELIKG